jgi:transcription antitermination factor NusG
MNKEEKIDPPSHGDKVMVIGGSLCNFMGVVEYVNSDSDIIQVLVNILGDNLSVRMEIGHVEVYEKYRLGDGHPT